MAKSDCEDCKGTGEIKTESVSISRSYMFKGRLWVETVGKGDWKMTQCHCVGEED